MKTFLKFFFIDLILSALFFHRAFTRSLLIAPGDAMLEHYPWRLYFSSHFIHHGIHLWVPYFFLGLPYLGTMETGILYPFNWFYFFISPPYVYNFSLIAHYALAAAFTFIYLRSLGVRPFPAFLAGIAFAFPGFLMTHKQHPSMVNAAVWLPLILYFYEKIRKQLKIKDALRAALTIGVQIFAGHFQISFFTYILLLLFTFVFFFTTEKTKRLRFLTLCALPVALGLLIGLPQILAVKELLAGNFHAALGLRTIVKESYHPELLGTLLFPFLFGGGFGINYAGPGYLIEFLGFTGILALAVSFSALIRLVRTDIQVRFWGSAAFVALVLMLGGNTPLAELFVRIPLLHSFRAFSRYILLFDLSIAVLFGIGLDYCFKNKDWKNVKLVLMSISLIQFFILWMKPVQFFTPTSPIFWIPAAFTLIYLIWSYAAESFHHAVIPAILFALVFSEALLAQFSFDADWPPINYDKMLLHDPAVRFVAARLGHERFAYYGDFEGYSYAGLPLVNAAIGARLLNAYHPLIPENVQNLADVNYLGYFYRGDALFRNNLILSLLAARYILFPPDSGQILTSLQALPRFKKGTPETLPSLFPSSFRLQSADGKTVSVLKQPIPFYPGVAYEIGLDAKAGQPLTSQLTFDLYAADFHSHDTQLSIFPEEISTLFQRYSKFIFAPQKIHGPLFARIYSFSKKTIDVRGVSIKVMKNYQPYFMNGRTGPLYQNVFRSNRFEVYENRNALPRLFAVKSIRCMNTLDDMKESIYRLQTDPGQTAFLFPSEFERLAHNHFSKGAVNSFDENTDRIEAQVQFSGDGFLILSDQYFPGWEATVDGHKTKIYCVDGALRGIEVPRGRHIIVFRYRPVKIYFAGAIGLSALIFVCIGLNKKSRISPSEPASMLR